MIIIIIASTITCALLATSKQAGNIPDGFCIVIDAGHGGIDGGSVGVVTKNEEKKLNLEYAQCLKDYFENFSFNVVLTRTNMDGLYSALASNKKKSDMQERKRIIDAASPDLVLSIHMNSFPLKSSKGAQVFHRINDEPSTFLAQTIQKQLQNDFSTARKSCKGGDFFLLNCAPCPSVLVECGFLSNPEEDKLLASESYKEKMCYSIFCGVVAFLGADNI